MRLPWHRPARPVRGSVVVLTGASSGIGRLAARRFAAEGAKVVAAARSAESLAEVVRECEQVGGEAIAVPTDVASAEQVEALAERAVERFGRIDVWVSNAAVLLFGRFEDAPAEAYDHVVRTNLFGEINGARAALRQFRRQGAGVLVNLGSMWGVVPSPYVSPYVVSHFGARAFSACLRQELRDAPDIHSCVVSPQSVDTPMFEHAANYVGRRGKPIPPVVPPERVVDALLDCARSPRPEVFVARSAWLLHVLSRVAPKAVERIAAPAMDELALGDHEVVRGPGNVFEPRPEQNAVRGGWRDPDSRLPGLAVLGSAALLPLVLAARRR